MGQQRSLVTLRLRGALFVVAWGVLAWYQASLGNTVIATLVALPVVAVVLALVSPSKGPGYFAFMEHSGVWAVRHIEAEPMRAR